ncbi:MAG: hypothetical protein Q8942_15430 [Bacillota bacterium]|nr:hypothetical protein [Bacillota bacterium]
MPNIIPDSCSCGQDTDTANSSANTNYTYFYGIGNISVDFPSLNIEKEFYQVAPKGSNNPPNVKLLFDVLSKAENKYLAKEMCWKFQQGSGLATFILTPNSDLELASLISGIEPLFDIDYDVVIGLKGPLSSPQMCNGVILPVITCNKVMTYTLKNIISNISKELGVDKATATDLFKLMLPLLDNPGDTDGYRALNYVTLNYMQIYKRTMELVSPVDPQKNPPYNFVEVRTVPANIQGERKLIDVIYTYNRLGEQIRLACRVDITGLYPFLVSPIFPYYTNP